MFDRVNAVRTKEMPQRLGRNYGTVKTHLHLSLKQGVAEAGESERVAAADTWSTVYFIVHKLLVSIKSDIHDRPQQRMRIGPGLLVLV